eukprot:scaffold31178_cov154-Skeletonema_menzelii.AAC.7
MASTAPPPPISSPVIPSSSNSTAGPPHLPRPASAPSTGAGVVPSSTTHENTHVSESAYEFLLAEILQWVERDEKRIAEEARRLAAAVAANQSSATTWEQGGSSADNDTDAEGKSKEEAAAAVMAAERSAARIERMGYDVGYRLCERLAQHRPLLGPGSPSPEADNSVLTPTDGANLAGVGNNPIIMGGGGHNTTMDPKTQLEAVKFLCKEFWTEVFRKQIDKLQTNHRGVFVLKDLELKWLRRLPPDEESARVGAIRILAFPCGLIRGALACLGLNGAVVSCDFLADGRTMASCSFNIKVK